MEFSATFQAPIVETIEGQSVTLPLLKSGELAAIAEKIRADRKAAAKATANDLKFNQTQVYRALQEIDDTEISTGELVNRIRTVHGAEQVVQLSAVKGGYTKEQAEGMIDSLSPIELTELAMRITRIIKLATGKAVDNVQRPLDVNVNPTPPTGSPSAPALDVAIPAVSPAS